MGYVVGLGLQNPELKILFQSDSVAEIWMAKVQEVNNFLFIFFIFVKI